jgi:hypothetical protein
MVVLLNQNNVFNYLSDLGYHSEKSIDNIEPLSAKNFNLLVTLTDELKLLVKQERHNHQGKAAGEFLGEWQIQGLIQDFPVLEHWQPFLSAMRHFDRENSILVFEYLQDYRDLMDFYLKENTFPESIAQKLGTVLATINRDTYNQQEYQDAIAQKQPQQKESGIVRLIDWERSAWGDPAFDLGTAIGSYLQMWLNSLVVSKSLSIEESLSLAMTPLDRVQPSIAMLTRAYLTGFPEILVDRPDFIQRVVQFAGLAVIQSILASIEYQKTLVNSGISRLQVAKSLLCRPVQSMPTVFGTLEFMPQMAAVA